MNSAVYINFNGSIVNASQPVLLHTNRAFRYGDAVFETIRLMNGEILFLEKHLARLKRGMEILSMKWHPDFSFQNLHLLIRHLDQVNNLKGNGRIRLEAFRKEGGFYTPTTDEVHYIIEAESLSKGEYVLNETGLRVGIFTDASKPLNKLSNLKSSNALIYVMAGLQQRKSNFDDLLLFNADGNIAEAIASNIFAIVRGELITPPIDQGCVAGIMREHILDLMKLKKKKYNERKITSDDLLHADEVFLTNVIEGIRWVAAITNKRYFNAFSRSLVDTLNDQLKQKA